MPSEIYTRFPSKGPTAFAGHDPPGDGCGHPSKEDGDVAGKVERNLRSKPEDGHNQSLVITSVGGSMITGRPRASFTLTTLFA